MALLALLAVCGCGAIAPPERPATPGELIPEPDSGDEPLSLQDDYWTRDLGDYLSPEELHQYWIEPQDKRFVTYGERWLEFCLREDLLAERRWELTPEQVTEFRAQPDFEAGARLLEAHERNSSE